jgi:hypothetical protein
LLRIGRVWPARRDPLRADGAGRIGRERRAHRC